MRLRFEDAALWEKKKCEVLKKINQRQVPLVLFGRAFPVNPGFLREITVPIQYICDNDPKTWGTRLWELEIIPPAKLQEIYSAYTVLILVPFENEIVPQLQQLPTPPVEIFRLDLYFEEEGTSDYFRKMQSIIDDTYARLADQESRDTYEAALQYRIGRNTECLLPVVTPRVAQYFPETLGGNAFLDENEIFVDVGAFTGDTVQQFVAAVHGKYRAIHAFEPEPEIWAQLQQNVRAFSKVTCRQIGIGDEVKTVKFSFGGSSSKADKFGEQIVQIEPLDHVLDGVPVTYLKMDIEGMEQSALRGARELIRAYRPKLAICTYHSNADMVWIPRLIWEINPDYKIYFRHYSRALVETICYAV